MKHLNSQRLFCQNLDLNVPGMTDFKITENCKLGSMPIDKILQRKHPLQTKIDLLRYELYLTLKTSNLSTANKYIS